MNEQQQTRRHQIERQIVDGATGEAGPPKPVVTNRMTSTTFTVSRADNRVTASS